ncbi:MAG TPA: aminomethyltransferase family protein, partial [Ilumatobacteraceae bacterium]|nr:aminomethyltransferase family protein [Ilumatobacteraceae bacterium]
RLHSTGSWPHSQPTTARDVRRSPLHDRLVAAGGRFAESSGWENVSYFAPIDAEIEFRHTYGRPDWFDYHAAEHRSVREAVGLFDMSAMSKFLVQGSDAEAVLNRLSGNDVAVPVGRCVYTQWMNERGEVKADVTITRLADDRFQVVVAEAFHRRVESMLARGMPDGARVVVTDVTSGWALLSVQGPGSRALLSELTTADLSNAEFPYLTAKEIDLHHARALAVRMSFVGELGWELFVPTEFSAGVYDRLVEVGAAHGLVHAGMATLESTRTEAGRLDYGFDMENSDSPLEAGLKFAVDFDKPGGFVGRDALLAQYEQRPYRNRLVQFLLDDPEPLLHGEEPILLGGVPVGYVRSGAYGHTLGGSMGFGYVEHADGVTGDLVRGGDFEIVVAGERFPAQASLRSMYDPANERVRM